MIPPSDDELRRWLLEAGIADPDLGDLSRGNVMTDYGSVSDESLQKLRELIVEWALRER